MRRGWIVAGTLVVVAVPSVPVAAAGVSLVLERVNGADSVGKWVRTGDVQRFRVRLNGMASGARVAVAADPVEALSEVSCLPSAGPSPSASGAPARDAVAPPSDAGAAMARASSPGAVAAGALAVRALAAAKGSAAAGTAPIGPAPIGPAPIGTVSTGTVPAGAVLPGARVCALGEVAGERAVDVTLKAPAGAREVVLAAVARMRGTGGEGPTTMSRTTAVRVRQAITGDAATFSGPARLLRPAERTKSRAEDAKSPAVAVKSPVVDAEGSAEVVGTRAEGARSRGEAGKSGKSRAEAAESRAETAESRDKAEERQPVAEAPAAEVTLPEVVPQVLAGATPSTAASTAAPQATQAPLALPSATGVASSGPTPAPGEPVVASPGPVASFQAGAAGGEAPLPWEVAVSARAVHPVGWVSPIDGPRALPMVAGSIGVLMGSLWLVVTVQRRRNRRKVL
ncbi:hypothetical protein ACBJ59_28965 [Nonomuraea sp. MTCD27]|uniref:hypothetical protein n=1 Tax=Nonomuraea sp. MTCD27 TaxID=1676747 RepID=UPI0035C08BF2